MEEAVPFSSLGLVIFSVYAQVAKQETRLIAYREMFILALGTAGKTMFVNFIAKSNVLLVITDDFSEMVGNMFPDSDIAKKFPAGRTKVTQIIKGACSRF